MTIRRLAPPDARAYRALMLEAYERHPDAFTSSATERMALPLSWWESRLDPLPNAAQIVLGALEGDRLIGSAGLLFEPREKSSHKAMLFGMYIAASSRRAGFGGRLVQAVLAQAAAREGVKLVQLTVTDGNTAAQALYERHGFASFGIEPFAVALDGAFLSKVHMWRALGPMG